jgi:hypothetical protein
MMMVTRKLTTLAVIGALASLGVGCKKKDEGGTSASASASASAAPTASGSTAAAPSASSTEPADPCAKDKVATYNYADVKFDWTDKPSIDKAPKDKAYASAGVGKPFELESVEIWVTERDETWSLRTKGGGVLGPSLSLKGTPKTGMNIDEKWGSNRGYFQLPKKGETARCFGESTSYNGSNARIVKLTRYDGKTADGVFVTTWEESWGEKRKPWAAGTFKNAKVVIFKK